MSRNVVIGLRIIGVASTVVLAFLCVFRCGAMWGFSYPLYIVLGVIGFIFSWFIMGCLHEVGHLVLGLIGGFKMERLKVFNILISRKEGKFCPSIEKMSSFIGLCEMYPATCKNLKKSYLLLSIGGVLFTALVLVVDIILFFIPLFAAIEFGGYSVYSFFLMWLPASFFYTFFNAVPFYNDDGYSDGAVILGIIKNSPPQQVTLSALAIQQKMYEGLSPKQIDRALYFNVPQIMETDPAFVMLLQLRYMYYMDSRDYVNAVACIERLEEMYDDLPYVTKTEVAMDILFTYSIGGGDFKKTDTYFSDCAEELKRKTARSCIVMAAYELSFDRKTQAQALIDEALRLVEFEKIKGKAAYEAAIARVIKKFA